MVLGDRRGVDPLVWLVTNIVIARSDEQRHGQSLVGFTGQIVGSCMIPISWNGMDDIAKVNDEFWGRSFDQFYRVLVSSCQLQVGRKVTRIRPIGPDVGVSYDYETHVMIVSSG